MTNPYSDDPADALDPLPARATGWRIWRMLAGEVPDCGMSDYRDAFDRRNLLVGPWQHRAAAPAADRLGERLRGRTVLLFGARLRDAFHLGHAPCGSSDRRHVAVPPSTEAGLTYWHWVPHPSGLCHWYNDEKNRRNVGRLLARFYRGERGVLEI